jgi:hypothetical protein
VYGTSYDLLATATNKKPAISGGLFIECASRACSAIGPKQCSGPCSALPIAIAAIVTRAIGIGAGTIVTAIVSRAVIARSVIAVAGTVAIIAWAISVSVRSVRTIGPRGQRTCGNTKADCGTRSPTSTPSARFSRRRHGGRADGCDSGQDQCCLFHVIPFLFTTGQITPSFFVGFRACKISPLGFQTGGAS